MTTYALANKPYTVYRGRDGSVVPTTATLPGSLGPHDVVIRLTHTGVCHTDALCFGSGAPLALGHEGVGVVEAVGGSVSTLKVGDRAGGGFHRDACGHCGYCTSGNDIYCYERVMFGEGDFDNGTFAEYFVGKETFVHRIPDGLDSASAAPLQCAGATVYAALVDTVKPRDRVAVVGVGGLGHLAIQYAAKMGAEVVVLSTTKDKEDEARGFGAAEFHILADVANIQKPVDVLIVAGARYPDWQTVMEKSILARNGTVVPLAAPVTGALALPANRMFWNGYHVHSSLVASRRVHDDMLEFSARHGIKPVLQTYKIADGEGKVFENAFKEMHANKVRYRAVVEL